MFLRALVACVFVSVSLEVPIKIALSPTPPSTFAIQGVFTDLYFYYTTLTIGSTSFTVIIDTGSSDLLVPDVSCTICPGYPNDPFFNCSSSSTCSVVPCDTTLSCSCNESAACSFVVPYAGFYEAAYAYWDEVRWGGVQVPAVKAAFGGTYNVSMGRRRSLPLQSTSGGSMPEGLLGLAYPSLNALGTTPLWALLGGQTGWSVFSLCLKENGGRMALGEIGDWGKGPVAYTPIVEENFYTFNMTDLLVNGQSLGLAPSVYTAEQLPIVDTGTPFATLNNATWAALRAVLTANCSAAPLVGLCTGVANASATLFDGFCYSLSAADVAAWPTLTWVLEGGVELPLTPALYVRPLGTAFCADSSQTGLALSMDPVFTIIGASMMQGFTTIFDTGKGRLGFQPLYSCQ